MQKLGKRYLNKLNKNLTKKNIQYKSSYLKVWAFIIQKRKLNFVWKCNVDLISHVYNKSNIQFFYTKYKKYIKYLL